MADIALSVKVDRLLLGLTDLDLNDHATYYVSDQNFLGGTVSYERSQVSSPFIDGQITTYRHKMAITDQISIEVVSFNLTNLMNNIRDLVQAFSQDTFNMQIAWGTSKLTYQCEAADYTVNYNKERWANSRALVAFQFIRQPTPLAGGF